MFTVKPKPEHSIQYKHIKSTGKRDKTIPHGKNPWSSSGELI